METPSRARARIPGPIRDVVAALERAGHASFLVGGCVRSLACGEPAHDFDVATEATPEQSLALFPRAIPIGLRHGTIMVPTSAGPVDLTRFRAGPELADDLARRDFTVNAVALALGEGDWIDPEGGLDDLAARRLRAVRSAPARLAEDPLRMLRAARLVATLGLEPDPELVAAMRAGARQIGSVAGERIRSELDRLLPARGARAGLALLATCEIDRILAPGIAPEAPERVAAMPRELRARLVAWLLGTRVYRIMARLRYPRRLTARVALVCAIDPVERSVDPESGVSIRRLLQRLEGDEAEILLALAEARRREAGEPLEPVARLRSAIARVRASHALALRRQDLALDGSEVMEILRCGPGPDVGAALRYLTECVIEAPDCNTREGLTDRLRAWHHERPRAAAR